MQLLPKRTRVFDVGDPARIVYLVKSGKVRIARLTPDGKEVTVAVLGSGDIFGEETLFDATQPRSTVADLRRRIVALYVAGGRNCSRSYRPIRRSL